MSVGCEYFLHLVINKGISPQSVVVCLARDIVYALKTSFRSVSGEVSYSSPAKFTAAWQAVMTMALWVQS